MKQKNDKGLVSFIIAAYNEEKYVVECIDSCLTQTHPNIEVCLTDDGSTDKTWETLVRHYQNESRVFIDRFDKNRGKIFAFNNSYKHSSGDYIAVIGADDVCFPHRIENSYAFLIENKCDLIFGKQLYCDVNLSPIDYGQRKFRKTHLSLSRILMDNTCSGPTFFLTRQMAEKCFPIPENLKFEDWWIAFISILYGKVGYMNEYLTKYRQHRDNDNADIDNSHIVSRLKKDFLRHNEYYECFYKEINSNLALKNKERILKLIRLNAVYRNIFMKDALLGRLRLFPDLLKNISPSVPFFAGVLLTAFGNRIYNLKRLNIYKKLFYYHSNDLHTKKLPWTGR